MNVSDKHECEIDNGGCGVSEVCIDSYGGHYCVTAGATAVSAASTSNIYITFLLIIMFNATSYLSNDVLLYTAMEITDY